MYFIYVDESGDPGFRGGTNYYVLLGVAVAEEQVNALARQMDDIVGRHLGQSGIELHFRKLVRGHAPFDRLSEQNRWRLVDDIFAAIGSSDVTLFASVIDKRKHQDRYTFPERPDILALELLVERFDIFLGRRNQLGCVVYDSRGKAVDDELRNFFSDWRYSGTSARKLRNIIETIFFAPSHATRLLQVADFCAHATFLHYERGNSQRFNQIEGRFDRNPQTNNVKGYGIKEWP